MLDLFLIWISILGIAGVIYILFGIISGLLDVFINARDWKEVFLFKKGKE